MARRRLTDEERARKRAEDRDRAVKAVEALRTSEGWQRWLRVRRHFHGYSLHNQLLIALQAPEATMIAGFSAWKKLGYAVRKGEKGIRIWAPRPPSRKAIEEWKQAGADPAAKPKTRFGTAAVFDRAQVDPIPGAEVAALDPPATMTLQGDSHAWLLEPLDRFARSIYTNVRFEPVGGSAHGYCAPAKQLVVIDDSYPPNSQVRTLIHELAHMLAHLHKLASATDDAHPARGLSYAEEELIVESVAYTVTASVGLDTTTATIPYLASWAQRATLDTIEQTADLIDTIASELEHAAEPNPEPPAIASVATQLDAQRRREQQPAAA